MPRRKKPPAGPPVCKFCTARIWWGLARPGQGDTTKPLDPTLAVYIDIDQPDQTNGAFYDEFRCRTRGAVIHDLASHEQRAAAAGRGALQGEGVRRIVRAWPVHACEPAAVAAHPQPATHNPLPALGGQDKAAGEG